MPLDPEARALMLELALPIDPPRREAFLAAVTERLEASPVSGPGAVRPLGVSCNVSISMRPTCTAGRQGFSAQAFTGEHRRPALLDCFPSAYPRRVWKAAAAN